MKILQPKLSSALKRVSDLRTLIQEDESLSELLIEDADISTIKAKSVELSESKVISSNFSELNVERMQVRECVFKNSDLSASVLGKSSWHVAEMAGCRCSGMQLQESLMKNVVFRSSKLDIVNFRFAKLENVLFDSCVINGMDFYKAKLKNVVFENCIFENVEFSESQLVSVDMTKSTFASIKGLRYLKGAVINYSQLMQLAPAMANEIGVIVKD